MAGGSTGPAAASRSVSWLVNASMADRFLAAGPAESGIRQARCHGTRRSPGFAQCHIQIG
jgi:hypothetical protein